MYIFVHLLVLLMHFSLIWEFWSIYICMVTVMLVTRLCSSSTFVTNIDVTHLYLIRAFSVTILWVAASFSFEKNKSGFQICFRTSECTVSTSICVSLIVSFRPFWLFQKDIIISAPLRYEIHVNDLNEMYCDKD